MAQINGKNKYKPIYKTMFSVVTEGWQDKLTDRLEMSLDVCYGFISEHVLDITQLDTARSFVYKLIICTSIAQYVLSEIVFKIIASKLLLMAGAHHD